VWVTGVFAGDGAGAGNVGTGGGEGGDGPGSCRFSFNISNIVLRSP